MIKWIIGIVVVAAAGVALWWSGWLGGMPSPTATSTPQTTNQQVQTAPENGMSANNDASDTALLQDQAAIDAQLGELNKDQASVDSSLSDKPVQQSY